MQHSEIQTHTGDTATVDGRLIHRGHYATIYDAAVAQVLSQARHEGRAILAKAIDGSGNTAFWIRVSPDGRVDPADAPIDFPPAMTLPPIPTGRHTDLNEAEFDPFSVRTRPSPRTDRYLRRLPR